MKKIEEFKVAISKEGRFFVAIIDFSDGEERATQGESIYECYDMIADLLKTKYDNTAKEKE